ncbi:glycosyltransferase [Fulvivirga maritima]|uniref:glycosyltransferase n=1 Tax=Fulvivirga maritima TaxID=2904247 RepID=UPI001F22444F|nr:glycosyltransferase [Fulvivirga maritima]UII24835.1 glycosyltransferase [Fulvivirga maritima]
MTMPLVTIYITNYNYASYIEESIESVLNQSCQDFELLIIDDGSTDNSKEIIERYRDNPKVSIIYQKNKGLNITNNVAMRTSNGKYIMRLDADDFLEPHAILEMSSVLEGNDELGLVFPDYYYVNAQGVRTGVEKRHNFEKEVSLYDQPAHGACTMIRLEFLKNLGGYNESFTCQDGYDLWIKFILNHKVTNITSPLFSYRRHGNNLTTNEERILDTRKKIKEYYVERHLDSKSTLAVIPVRNSFIGKVNLPLFQVDEESVIEKKIKVCIDAKKIDYVIVSTSDSEIFNFLQQKYANSDRVSIIRRPAAFSDPNETLFRTIEHALDYVKENVNMEFEAIMTVSPEYPFLKSDTVDDAIYTLSLFQSDTVLSVRPDNRTYYQHTGHTLKPILDQDKFTKLEREALYKGAGGVVVSTIENFKKNKKLVSGSISHVVVDEQTAFGIFNSFHFSVYRTLMSAKDQSSVLLS